MQTGNEQTVVDFMLKDSLVLVPATKIATYSRYYILRLYFISCKTCCVVEPMIVFLTFDVLLLPVKL